jgi:hypothetical protein
MAAIGRRRSPFPRCGAGCRRLAFARAGRGRENAPCPISLGPAQVGQGPYALLVPPRDATGGSAGPARSPRLQTCPRCSDPVRESSLAHGPPRSSNEDEADGFYTLVGGGLRHDQAGALEPRSPRRPRPTVWTARPQLGQVPQGSIWAKPCGCAFPCASPATASWRLGTTPCRSSLRAIIVLRPGSGRTSPPAYSCVCGADGSYKRAASRLYGRG